MILGSAANTGTIGGGMRVRAGRPRQRAGAVLAVALALTSGWALATAPWQAASAPEGQPAAAAAGRATVLPLAARGPVSAALGADRPGYRIDGLRALNPSQRLRASFSAAGVTIRSGAGTVSLSLIGFGRGDGRAAAPRATPSARANRVTYDRGPVREWYVNGPLGLEQGFDVLRAPANAGGGGPLTLSLVLGGNLRPSLRDGSLRLEGHGANLSYGGLYATDARGRRLPASLSLHGGRLTISVDDRHARYPLRIDPFVQQAELTPSDTVAGGSNPAIGTSVAISADGSTIVAGAPFKSMNTPAGGTQTPDTVYVFTRPGSGWANATQTAELTPSSDGLELGYSVAVSADGSTIVAGAPGDAAATGNSFTGAAYVFSRPAGGWTNETQAAKLTGADTGGKLGTSVAISADGATVVAGAPNHSTGGIWDSQGAAYVFARPGSSWADETQAGELTGSDSISTASLGGAVAISPSGDTVFAGASGQTIGANNGQGAVYVFAKPGSGWANGTQSAELTSSDGGAGDGFGSAVAASDAALVVGAPGHTVGSDSLTTNQGAAYVFLKPAGGWTPAAQQVELTLSSGMPAGGFGKSVAISGQTVAVGAPDEPYGPNIHQGLVYVATFASDWSGLSFQQQVVASNGADYDGLGGAVGLAGGSLAAAASNAQVGDALHAGAVYVFASEGGSGGSGAGTGPGTGGSGSGTGGSSAGGSVSLGRAKVKGTTASVPVTCAGGASCAVTVSLSVVERLKGGRLVAITARRHHPVRRGVVKRKTVVLGSVKVKLGAGQHQVVRVVLNRSGRRLLAAHHKLHVRLAATESSAGHTTTVAHRTVTFSAPRHKRRHHR